MTRSSFLPIKDCIPPSHEKPAEEEITEEDQREEYEYRREFKDDRTPMWSLGGPVSKSDDNDQSLDAGMYHKRLLATETDVLPSRRMKPSPHFAKGNTTAPENLTGQGTDTLPKPRQTKPKQHLEPVKFADDFTEAPLPCAFITDPMERIIQCVKVLCGNYGVMVDEFISLFIGEQGTAKIVEEIFEVIDAAFLQLLALPQSERAKAAKTILQPLNTNSSDMILYMAVLDVPAGAEFWKSFRHAFPESAVDEYIDHVMMYNGSGAGKGDATRNRLEKQHENEEYRKKNPSLFYAVMSEPKSTRTWCRVGVAKGRQSRALMHIVEAVAIATTHTYTSEKYTAFLKEFGIVEEDCQAFGCNRTGAMKGSIYLGRAVSSSAIQRVMHQTTLERTGGPLWTYETMPEVVKSWLSEEGFDKDQTLALVVEPDISLANAIHPEMARLGAKEGSSLIRELSIE